MKVYITNHRICIGKQFKKKLLTSEKTHQGELKDAEKNKL